MQGYNRVACEQRDTLLDVERAWLAALQPDLVVSDVVPLACAAAAAAGVRCVCVSNFSWDFVYSECAALPHARYQGSGILTLSSIPARCLMRCAARTAT